MLPARKKAIGGTFARGNTALYNGVYMTMKELVQTASCQWRHTPAGDCAAVGRRRHVESRRGRRLDGSGQARGRGHLHNLAADERLRDDRLHEGSAVAGRGAICDESAGVRDRSQGVLSHGGPGPCRRLRRDCRRAGQPVSGRLCSKEPGSRRVVPAHGRPRRTRGHPARTRAGYVATPPRQAASR